MPEQEPLYSNPSKKIPTPLERVADGVGKISLFMELSDEQHGILQRYANLVFRAREIKKTFDGNTVDSAYYVFEAKEKDAYDMVVTRDTQYKWFGIFMNEITCLREDYFDKNPNMETARKMVFTIVKDNTPQG